MTAALFIRPANIKGVVLQVRKPDAPTRFLDPEGEQVAPNRYWLRRIADGSVVKAAPLKSVKSVKADPTPKPLAPKKETDQ